MNQTQPVHLRNALISLQNPRYMRWRWWIIQKNQNAAFHPIRYYARGRDDMGDPYLRAVVRHGKAFLITDAAMVYPIDEHGNPVSWEQAVGK